MRSHSCLYPLCPSKDQELATGAPFCVTLKLSEAQHICHAWLAFQHAMQLLWSQASTLKSRTRGFATSLCLLLPHCTRGTKLFSPRHGSEALWC